MEVDNKKLGEAAVDAVAFHFLKVANVLVHAAKDDTGICTDGNLEVYSAPRMCKETLRGKIAIQVKGKRGKPSPRSSPTYPIDARDLDPFENVEGGILYFVVYFDSDLNLRGIYYKELLRYELNKIKQKCGSGKQTIRERFLPLPTDPDRLNQLCLEFLTDQEKQAGRDVLVFTGPDELRQADFPVAQYEFTKTVVGEEPLFSLATMESGMYMYARSTDGRRCVFDKHEALCGFGVGGEHVLGAGDFSGKYVTFFSESRDAGRTASFGGFTARFDGEAKLTLAEKGGFRARLRDLCLFRAIHESGELRVDGEVLCGKARFPPIDSAALDSRIGMFERYVRILDSLAVAIDWNPDEMTPAQFRSVDALGSAFVDGKPLKLGKHDEAAFMSYYEVCQTRIYVFAIKRNDGLYDLSDPMAREVVFVPNYKDGNDPGAVFPLPSMLALDAEGLSKAANISSDKFAECLERFPVCSGNVTVARIKLVDMLSAYDGGARCGKQLLECCKQLASALRAQSSDSEQDIINDIQTRMRANELTDDDAAVLSRLLIMSRNSDVKVAAAILLKKLDTARELLGLLDESSRQEFEEWPIYNLLTGEVFIYEDERTEKLMALL